MHAGDVHPTHETSRMVMTGETRVRRKRPYNRKSGLLNMEQSNVGTRGKFVTIPNSK